MEHLIDSYKFRIAI